MKISDISIRRPVLATVMNLVVVLLGLIAYDRLPVREYPQIDDPVVTVETNYRGASAEIIESQVTQPLEDSLSGIEGIDFMTSISRSERSQITLTFKLARDVEAAANDVRDRVARVRARLPDEIDEPVISKVEADAQPIIYLAFSSDRHSALDITDFGDRYVKDRLQTLSGVADVRIFGERRFAMRIWLDAQRLAAYSLLPSDIEAALRRQNVEVPAGRIEGQTREFTVVSETDLRTSEQFEQIVIKQADGYLVRLKDVARVEIGAQDERISARFNGRPAVAIGVVKQSVANPLDVSNAVRRVLPSIQQALPPGMEVAIAYDTSVFIDRSIQNVFRTIIEAIVLVLIIIFVFLRSLRATLIPLVTIPVSLIGAFALMYLFGFSINTLTLLSMVLAIGLVVDDAIVMLENIQRHVEEGMTPFRAALVGSREIGFAVLAMTVTLAAVYMPLVFVEGRTGRLFIEFALTLAGAVIVSGFVALTLSPMMASRLLRTNQSHGRVYTAMENAFNGMNNGYRRLLTRSLDGRWLVVGVALLVAGASYLLFAGLRPELTPAEDRGFVMGIGIAPEGATLDYTESYARRIEQTFAGVPEVRQYFLVTGFPVVNQAISFAPLKPWEDRERSSMQIAGSLFPQFMGIPGILAFPINPPSLGADPTQKPIQFVIQTSGTYADLQGYVDKLMAEARQYPGLQNLESDLHLNKPELRLEVQRDKALGAGYEVETIGRTLETLIGGRQVTRFKREGKQYDVILQLADVDRSSPGDIKQIYLPTRAGNVVPLSNFVEIQESVAPRELNHFNKLRAATITATPAPGYTLGDGVNFLTETAARVLPPSVQIDYRGQSREFRESGAAFVLILLLAVAFIYLVLAAQFESFVDPLIILMTVPLAATGAFLALRLTGGTWNVYSQIGIVTLIGLITKHGILIVEFANQLQERGRTIREAVIESATLRLRPILMTTGAMVLGSVPLAIATGAGAESRQQIGWVIVGGLLLGTLLTLFVVPSVYTLLARRRKPAEDEHAAPAAAHPHPAE